MSAGSRSGVNCTRAKSSPSTRARLRAAKVLPSPGKSSSSTCPLASTAERTSVSGVRLPITALSTASSTWRARAEASATERRSVGVWVIVQLLDPSDTFVYLGRLQGAGRAVEDTGEDGPEPLRDPGIVASE